MMMIFEGQMGSAALNGGAICILFVSYAYSPHLKVLVIVTNQRPP